MKKIIFRILLILCMIMIFMFSEQDRTTSLTTSDSVTKTITSTITKITNDNGLTTKEQEAINKKVRVIIRKIAHFTAYFTLGVLVFITIYQIKNIEIKRIILISLSVCFIYACSDELHQMFVNGRTSSIIDVLIDTTGSLFGIMIINFIYKKNLTFQGKCSIITP